LNFKTVVPSELRRGCYACQRLDKYAAATNEEPLSSDVIVCCGRYRLLFRLTDYRCCSWSSDSEQEGETINYRGLNSVASTLNIHTNEKTATDVSSNCNRDL